MAVAMATLSDSDVGSPGGYDGIYNLRVAAADVSALMPDPSLPITIMAEEGRGAV